MDENSRYHIIKKRTALKAVFFLLYDTSEVFLVTDCGFGAVAAVAYRLIRKFVEFIFYALDDLAVRTAWEVGATDAAAEQGVAGDEEILFFTIETAAAFGVTRSVYDFQFVVADFYNLSFV